MAPGRVPVPPEPVTVPRLRHHAGGAREPGREPPPLPGGMGSARARNASSCVFSVCGCRILPAAILHMAGGRPGRHIHSGRPRQGGRRPGHPFRRHIGRPGRLGRVCRIRHAARPAEVLGAPPARGRRVRHQERRTRHIPLLPAALHIPGRQGPGVGGRLRVPLPGGGRPGYRLILPGGPQVQDQAGGGRPPTCSPSSDIRACRPTTTAPNWRCATPPSCTGTCATSRPRRRAGGSSRCWSPWSAPAANRASYRGPPSSAWSGIRTGGRSSRRPGRSTGNRSRRSPRRAGTGLTSQVVTMLNMPALGT